MSYISFLNIAEELTSSHVSMFTISHLGGDFTHFTCLNWVVPSTICMANLGDISFQLGIAGLDLCARPMCIDKSPGASMGTVYVERFFVVQMETLRARKHIAIGA